MCGIVGYKGPKQALSIGLNCLKKLEYRGYDSSGFAINTDKTIEIEKAVGKIQNLEKIAKKKKFQGNTIILHTRWATHGGVTKVNAHPHSSKNQVAVVHNGIIENFQELRKKLANKGYKFVSETDTEVIPHLVAFHMKKNDFKNAVFKTLNQLEGAFAVLILDHKTDTLIAARKNAPLVFGYGKNEYFLASDVPAFLEHTKKVSFLKDDEMVVIKKNPEFYNFVTGEKINKKIDNISWNKEEAEKGGYKHFMLKEINEQPQVIVDTIQGRIKEKHIDLNEMTIPKRLFEKTKKVYMVACGTAYHACLVGKYWFEGLLNVPVEVDQASEFRYRRPVLDKNTIVIVVSQSGETADTLAALREAKKNKAYTISLVNVMGSTIARESNTVLYTRAGPEIGVASTKAFISQLTGLFLLTLYWGQETHKVTKNDVQNYVHSINRLPSQIESIIKKEKEIQKIAKKYYKYQNFLFLGRHVNSPIALEGSLKLKEISYIHSEGMPAGEMKHGPIALIDKNFPTVAIMPKSTTYTKMISNIQEIRARNGKIFAIATKGDKMIQKFSEDMIFIPDTMELLNPLLTVIPLQLFAYHVARLRKCDIDQPRNLAKSVTTE